MYEFLGNPTVTQHKTISHKFQKVCQGVKVTAIDQLVILCACLEMQLGATICLLKSKNFIKYQTLLSI